MPIVEHSVTSQVFRLVCDVCGNPLGRGEHTANGAEFSTLGHAQARAQREGWRLFFPLDGLGHAVYVCTDCAHRAGEEKP